MRLSGNRELAVQAAVVGLDRMACELREAVNVTSPSSPAVVGDLRFLKVDPSLTTRLPDPSNPTTYDPVDPSTLLSIHDYLQGQRLLREVSGRGWPVSRSRRRKATLAISRSP